MMLILIGLNGTNHYNGRTDKYGFDIDRSQDTAGLLRAANPAGKFSGNGVTLRGNSLTLKFRMSQNATK
ncbi:MAG: hypothetical protein JNJ58_05765 [Chitinophagaceae bacterium]|nr:hypothetical protein [Chitinophagaceae bacterium]